MKLVDVEILRIALIRPGATDFDEQGRIRGTLDIPLNQNGESQVENTIRELERLELEAVYCGPCRATQQTATMLAERRGMKLKRLEKLRNLDHGLWHGKLITEVRQTQPKVYRQWQENPEMVCPPGGESLESAMRRVQKAVSKLVRKHRTGGIALVVSEPLFSLVSCHLQGRELGDLWKAECESGTWELIELGADRTAALFS